MVVVLLGGGGRLQRSTIGRVVAEGGLNIRGRLWRSTLRRTVAGSGVGWWRQAPEVLLGKN